jgi:S-formylglutathione hydrolase FrmB
MASVIHARCDFYSEALELSTSMTVLLPQATRSQIGMDGIVRPHGTPVLYLLHGLSDDDTSWLRQTSIERYAAQLGLAVVMPQVHRSFYSDQLHGGRYWEFVADELPRVVRESFVVSDRRADTFVAGLSMGGYGAFKLALRHPDRFAAAGSLSGALDLGALAESEDRRELFTSIWGEHSPAGSDDDLLHLLDRADPTALPALWATCGSRDELLAQQRTFVEAAQTRGVDVVADEHPGEHEWGFWDRHIQRFLAWLPLR